MCEYDVNNPATDSQNLCGESHSIKNKLPMNPSDSVKLSSGRGTLLRSPPKPPFSLVSSARGSSQQNVAVWASVGVFVIGFLGWTGDIDQIIPTNKTYCFVMVWRMRLIHHPQSTLMNYWLVVSEVEPPGSCFQAPGLETRREIFTSCILNGLQRAFSERMFPS